MSTAVEYSCGDTNKHSGSRQKTQSRRVRLKSFTAGAGRAMVLISRKEVMGKPSFSFSIFNLFKATISSAKQESLHGRDRGRIRDVVFFGGRGARVSLRLRGDVTLNHAILLFLVGLDVVVVVLLFLLLLLLPLHFHAHVLAALLGVVIEAGRLWHYGEESEISSGSERDIRVKRERRKGRKNGKEGRKKRGEATELKPRCRGTGAAAAAAGEELPPALPALCSDLPEPETDPSPSSSSSPSLWLLDSSSSSSSSSEPDPDAEQSG
ncbi:hypothetical protein EYF80_034567 [Liparis tanakae]|uniref:Uncharacterized protein n=1 Tax=Liparis tanakae TaxID=230148 RepID=A0A4Z2GRC6_9TELE|nr:hypothetical protein EYF80_034567 [Liparis tanakae]